MKNKLLTNITPGEILPHDFMEPLGLSPSALAEAIGVTPMRGSQIVRGQRAITAGTALRSLPLLWHAARLVARLQSHNDLETAADKLEARIARTVKQSTS